MRSQQLDDEAGRAGGPQPRGSRSPRSATCVPYVRMRGARAGTGDSGRPEPRNPGDLLSACRRRLRIGAHAQAYDHQHSGRGRARRPPGDGARPVRLGRRPVHRDHPRRWWRRARVDSGRRRRRWWRALVVTSCRRLGRRTWRRRWRSAALPPRSPATSPSEARTVSPRRELAEETAPAGVAGGERWRQRSRLERRPGRCERRERWRQRSRLRIGAHEQVDGGQSRSPARADSRK